MNLEHRVGRAARAGLFVAVFLASTVPSAASGRPISFSAPDGTPLTALWYESTARPAPGVVLVHMLGRSKDDWGFLADRLQDAGAMVLTLDLRGHGTSGGSPVMLAPMVTDVGAAVDWLATRPNLRPGALAVVGASLGANLGALAAAESRAVRALGLVSPSLDYRSLRLDSALMKRLGDRPVWLAASAEDPYALRTIKELAATGEAREERVSSARAHGTNLLAADPDLAQSLLDWLRRTLSF